MKITANRDVQDFKPISVTLVIETQRELDALKEMVGRNISIPKICADSGYKEEVFVFLCELAGAITR